MFVGDGSQTLLTAKWWDKIVLSTTQEEQGYRSSCLFIRSLGYLIAEVQQKWTTEIKLYIVCHLELVLCLLVKHMTFKHFSMIKDMPSR